MQVLRYWLRRCLLLLSTLFLIACSNQHTPSNHGNHNQMNPLTLYFNKETGAQFATRTQARSSNPLPTSQTTFYNLDWDKNPIDVLIEHGANSITLHHVIGVQAATAGTSGIVTSYNNISAGLSNDNTMSHDQARLTMLAIFKDLKQAGWQRYISLSGPRLTGKDAWGYAKKELYIYTLDPDYIYSLDEWMQLGDGASWMLQANGIYLTITIRRDQTKMDPQQPGAYYVSYKFESEKEYYAPYFKDDDLKKWEINAARWVSLYPGVKKQMNQIREKTEAELKAQGITIDESYQDPALVSKN
ncbi:hypothetical protein ACG9YX_00605 [Acinetobacter nematophilus]|uniref:hypothetical protein n=1 Tax=Acinetobacter nematophilus TaxID=2994642 RepID=UPI003AF75E74